MNTRNAATTLLIVVALAALVTGQGGCGWAGSPAEKMVAERAEAPSFEMAERSAAPADEAVDAESVDLSKATGSPGTVTRRIIRTGELTLEVSDLPATVDQISNLAEQAGGYVSGSRVYETDEGRRRGTVQVRVPADKFAEVFSQLRQIGKALSYSEDASDVTEEWVDLEARISNKKAEEKSLLALLERKGELKDILEIQREIFRVRGEVEQLEGRLRYLKDQVGLSTISVSLDEFGAAALAERGPWRLMYHLRTAWVALARTVEGIVYGVIYLLIAGAVVWMPLVLLIWWIRRRRRARRAQET